MYQHKTKNLYVPPTPSTVKSPIQPFKMIHPTLDMPKILGNQAILQMVKNESNKEEDKEDYFTSILPKDNALLNYSKWANSEDKSEIKTTIEKAYRYCYKKGNELYKKIKESIENDPNSEKGKQYQQILDKENDEKKTRFYKNYSSEIKQSKQNLNLYEVKTKSMTADNKKSKFVAYHNNFDLEEGNIIAISNNSGLDDHEKTKTRLQNSDIIWHQYLEAINFSLSKNQTQNKNEADYIDTLKKFKRENITNAQTNIVARLLCGTNATKPVSFTDNQDGFFALLGTDNCQSAGYMLAQHISGKNKIISKITVYPSKDSWSIEITYEINEQGYQ
ncbi:hypothetical protein [Paenibacillus campi]|uniref:hypothetical protein n=1 Tax=Paenibacillus campi TaxID=3106031 RepID=UPI002AFFA543|nr:hypothetical protein [Paenibacillus sp. SGZ-1009]